MNWCAYEMDHKIEERHAREEGLAEGRKEGQNRILLMNQRLIQEKRYEDLERASRDDAYRERLLAELFPEEND